jgi:hypothetical protein
MRIGISPVISSSVFEDSAESTGVTGDDAVNTSFSITGVTLDSKQSGAITFGGGCLWAVADSTASGKVKIYKIAELKQDSSFEEYEVSLTTISGTISYYSSIHCHDGKLLVHHASDRGRVSVVDPSTMLETESFIVGSYGSGGITTDQNGDLVLVMSHESSSNYMTTM